MQLAASHTIHPELAYLLVQIHFLQKSKQRMLIPSVFLVVHPLHV
jgi:hypothetical protein